MMPDLENTYRVLEERAEQVKYIENFIYSMEAFGKHKNDEKIVEKATSIAIDTLWLIGREFSILMDKEEEEKCVNQSEFPHP